MPVQLQSCVSVGDAWSGEGGSGPSAAGKGALIRELAYDGASVGRWAVCGVADMLSSVPVEGEWGGSRTSGGGHGTRGRGAGQAAMPVASRVTGMLFRVALEYGQIWWAASASSSAVA